MMMKWWHQVTAGLAVVLGCPGVSWGVPVPAGWWERVQPEGAAAQCPSTTDGGGSGPRTFQTRRSLGTFVDQP